MDVQKLAADLLPLVGGKENIRSVLHCMTRLRFQLADQSKAQLEAIEKLDGVMGVKVVGAQTQVIIGPIVAEVYKAVTQLTGDLGGDAAPAPAEGEEKQKLSAKLLDMISGILKLTAPQYIWDIMKNFQINNTKRFIPIHDNLPEIIVKNLGRDFTLNDFAVPDGSVGLIHASITRMNDLRRRYHRELQNGNTEEAYTYLEQIVQCCPASYLISGYISFDYGVLKKLYSYLVTLSYHARFNSYRDMMRVLREIPYSELFITNPGDERDIYGIQHDYEMDFSPMNPTEEVEETE